jgi:hypothetical protein
MGSRSPELAEVIRTWIAGARADIHTALPAKVTRVDLAKGLVDVKPLIKSGWENDDGDRVVEAVPVICDVPIAFPGAGGMRVTFPVTVDDTGLVLFSEASLDAWLDAPAGNDVDPLDDRRHHLSDGIFLPGLRPASSPWTADASVLTIGATAARQTSWPWRRRSTRPSAISGLGRTAIPTWWPACRPAPRPCPRTRPPAL